MAPAPGPIPPCPQAAAEADSCAREGPPSPAVEIGDGGNGWASQTRDTALLPTAGHPLPAGNTPPVSRCRWVKTGLNLPELPGRPQPTPDDTHPDRPRAKNPPVRSRRPRDRPAAEGGPPRPSGEAASAAAESAHAQPHFAHPVRQPRVENRSGGC